MARAGADPPTRTARNLRPSIKSHGDYVLGLLLAARRSARGGRRLLPGGRLRPHDGIASSRSARRRANDRRSTRRHIAMSATRSSTSRSPGMIAYYLVDDVADRYIDLIDEVDDEIDELEEEHRHVDRREVTATDRGAATRPAPHPQDPGADQRRGPRGRRRPGRHRGTHAVHARGLPAGGRASVRDHVRQAPARRRKAIELRARPALRREFATTSRRAYAIDQNEVDEEADLGRIDPPRPDLHRRASTVRTSFTCPSTAGATGTPGRGP